KPKKSFVKKQSKCIFGKIQKINKIKSDVPFVFDLSVTGYENYLIEGIITHNSPWPNRFGREFTRIKMLKPNFINLKKSLKEKEEKLISLNVGLDPKEGKYHLTACQSCYAQYFLEQAKKLNFKCIQCGKEIKKGVKDRINELKDLEENNHPSFRPKYLHSVPLAEIIQNAFKVKNANSVKVQSNWNELIDVFGNEINILVDEPIEEISKINPLIAEYINAFRKGLVVYEIGGGGSYGIPHICKSKEELIQKEKELNEKIMKGTLGQKTLTEY
ncbi:MAG: hypothetical protein JW703_00625, partial [Candidatus Diapherotrites archaeon]|nr:hypothetical protein [Candidatus Diapherotrites archaeon]